MTHRSDPTVSVSTLLRESGVPWLLFCLISVFVPNTSKLHADPFVSADAVLERVSSGYGFLEGPSPDGMGGILFVDIDRGGTRNRPGRILRFDIATESVSTIVNEDKTIAGDAGTIGIDQLADGSIVLARGDQRSLSQLVGDTITPLATMWDGQVLNGPNDLVGDNSGGVFFTDPNFLGGTTVTEAVYYYTPTGTVHRVATGLNGPNGIGLSPDGASLYVAATRESRVYSYDVGADGMLSNKTIFSSTRTDGMTVDLSGNVYLSDTSASRVRAFTADGESLFNISMPESPTNLTFADDSSTLYITGRTALYRIPISFSLGCDFDENATCDIGDIDALITAIASRDADVSFDVTGDGLVNESDITTWLTESALSNGLERSYPVGDSNLDGVIDPRDLNNLALNWRQDIALWSGGDFTADGQVNAADLNQLALNWQQAASRTAVPEPSHSPLMMVGMSLAALGVGRKRRESPRRLRRTP